ncbi:MAG TPA: hypothetical protein VGF95_05955 [Solirubrobacteraceae bacterium]|jgi:hypothetical protein
MSTQTAERSGRSALRDEADVADLLLRAFEHMRKAELELRQRGEYVKARELERAAWELLGDAPPVRASYAQGRLGISDPTLRAWVARDIFQSADERPLRVTLASVARAELETRRIRANDQALTGRGITDALAQRLASARTLESPSLLRSLRKLGATSSAPEGHRSAERRSLALHEQIAARLDERMLASARRRVKRWLRSGGRVSIERARQWDAILADPLEAIRAAIVQDTPAMRDLRQDTPFAGTLSEAERLEILREAR